MKKSFILYADYYEHIRLLSSDQKARLLDAIFCHVLGQDIPSLDSITKMAFSFIRSQLDRDTQCYENKIENRRKAGQKGGLAKASKSSKAKQCLANLADTDTVNDNVNDTDTVTVNDTNTQAKLPSLLNQDDLQLEFDDMMGFYPQLATGFSRKKAYEAWIGEITKGESKKEIRAGIVRYQLYIRGSGKEKTKFVLQPHNFFINQSYKQPWEVPNEQHPNSASRVFSRIMQDIADSRTN